MSKIETLHNGYRLIIDKFLDNAGIPHSEQYRISTFNTEGHYHDEIVLTEDQWNELKNYVAGLKEGIISKPFSDYEIKKEFQPRFGGANPTFRDFYLCGWTAAFSYVNEKLLKTIK